jgi:hypothetical protein
LGLSGNYTIFYYMEIIMILKLTFIKRLLRIYGIVIPVEPVNILLKDYIFIFY